MILKSSRTFVYPSFETLYSYHSTCFRAPHVSHNVAIAEDGLRAEDEGAGLEAEADEALVPGSPPPLLHPPLASELLGLAAHPAQPGLQRRVNLEDRVTAGLHTQRLRPTCDMSEGQCL